MAKGASANPMDSAMLIAACREAGLKATSQRIEILRELFGCTSHPDAESLHQLVKQRLPTVSLDTVYRTLNRLVERGAAARFPGLQNRMRYEANVVEHHHFVCLECGGVQDIHHPAYDRTPPPPGIHKFGAVERVYVELRGVCRACRQKPAAGAAAKARQRARRKK